MSKPVTMEYTREQMLSGARDWMVETFGTPSALKADEREHWYIRLGIMSDFITEMFPTTEGGR